MSCQGATVVYGLQPLAERLPKLASKMRRVRRLLPQVLLRLSKGDYYSKLSLRLYRRYFFYQRGTRSIYNCCQFVSALKYTWESFDTFLDIKVCIEGNGLCTSVHYKPTDSHSYLLYSSSHPSHQEFHSLFSVS